MLQNPQQIIVNETATYLQSSSRKGSYNSIRNSTTLFPGSRAHVDHRGMHKPCSKLIFDRFWKVADQFSHKSGANLVPERVFPTTR